MVHTYKLVKERRTAKAWMYYAYYATGLLLIMPFVLPSVLVPRAWRRQKFAGLPKNQPSVLSEVHAELSTALAHVFR